MEGDLQRKRDYCLTAVATEAVAFVLSGEDSRRKEVRKEGRRDLSLSSFGLWPLVVLGNASRPLTFS